MMVGRLLSYREGFLFRGELLNLGRVSQWNATNTMVFSTSSYFTPPRKSCGKFRRTIPRSFVGRRGHGWPCVPGGRTVATKNPRSPMIYRRRAEVEKGFFPEKYMLQYKALWKLVAKGKLELRINLILQPENIPTFEIELEVLWNYDNSVAIPGTFQRLFAF